MAVSVAKCKSEDEANLLADFLEEKGISDVNLVDGGPIPEEENTDYSLSGKEAKHFIEVYVPDDSKDEAETIVSEYYEKKAPESTDTTEDTEADTSASHVYTSAKEKYEDNRSSGWTFTIFGIAGIIFTVLNITGVLGLYKTVFQFSVSGCMFAVFILIGVISFIKANNYKKQIGKEEDSKKKYTNWLNENITKEKLLEYEDPASAKEANDLIKISRIKEAMKTEFPEINDDLADTMAEEFYNKIE